MMNKRILITRPQAQNTALVNALQQQGHTPLVMPLLDIETYNESEHLQACEAIKNKVQRLDEYAHLVFISTNAVTAGWFWIDRYWPQLPATQYWYAIGEASGALLAHHVDGVQPAQHGESYGGNYGESAMNSESLLALPSLQNIRRQKVLVFRGKGGRDFLKQVLEERGAQVDYCEVYQRKAVRYDAGTLAGFLAGGMDLLTVTSGETLQLLLEQAVNDGIKEDIQKLPIVVPGQRVAGLATASGFKAVIVAANAGVPAMLKACN